MDMTTLANRLASRHHVSPAYAAGSVENLIGQIETLEGRELDPDAISGEDAEFLEGAFAASLTNDDNGRSDMADELTSVSDRLRDLQMEADELADTRNALIVELWGRGATVKAIVEASRLNRARVYAILHADDSAGEE